LSAGDASSQVVAIAKDLVHLADIKVLHGQDLVVAQELDGLLGIAVGQLIMECPHRAVQFDHCCGDPEERAKLHASPNPPRRG
jgi:hypothetical protein